MNQVSDKRRINFTLVENELIDNKHLDIYAKMTYIVLCRFAKDGQCFPSYQTIADKVGCSKRKIIDTMKVLLENGLIVKEIRKNEYDENTSNLYSVIGFNNESESNSQGSEQDAPRVVNDIHYRSEQDAPKQYIINNTKSNNQSINQEEPTLDEIYYQSRVELYQDEEVKNSIKLAISELYQDTETREVVKKIKIEHITTAIDRMRVEQEQKEIKNPLQYFKKVLLSCIVSSGITQGIWREQE